MNDELARVAYAPIPNVTAWWPSLSLARQFTLASSALVFLGLGVLGLWVSDKIEEGIKQHAGARTALYMESFVAPHLQELAWNDKLSDENAKAIDLVVAMDAMRIRVVAVKIWTRDGIVLYATRKTLVGQQFAVTAPLKRAWEGYIEIQFDDGPHLDHSVPTKAEGSDHLLEIYVPIRHTVNGNIIAVAEFYEIATDLERELSRAQLESWFVTALVSISIIAGLYSIVARGSKTIEMQRTSLADRIAHLSHLLQQNEDLRQRVQRASRGSAEDAELHLRRLGSDLHDGPAQLLALALLKLDRLLDDTSDNRDDRTAVRAVLNDAMTEIRNISAGLALPEIDTLSLTGALSLIVAEHERRTSTSVSCAFSTDSIQVSRPAKLCLCRFVQEALSNAFWHAEGVGQRVAAAWNSDTIVVEVSDLGAGFGPVHNRKRPALGLVGIRNRLEILGGTLMVDSKSGEGTRLTARLSVRA
jgi:signal transduction histidine kinase